MRKTNCQFVLGDIRSCWASGISSIRLTKLSFILAFSFSSFFSTVTQLLRQILRIRLSIQRRKSQKTLLLRVLLKKLKQLFRLVMLIRTDVSQSRNSSLPSPKISTPLLVEIFGCLTGTAMMFSPSMNTAPFQDWFLNRCAVRYRTH